MAGTVLTTNLINTEAKYLLLRHAFEDRQCIRVEFVTDVLNEKSRAALLRIGAKQGRHTSQSHDYAGWSLSRLGVFQHY
jgi:RimJ/RimL family protein N-acetyltransferase